ncbi:MAG: hypothetical protein A2798_02215 [Candidatus Levybacteria bacterium RIFCSPHIGHO2_01_FULL_37_17]|nr:MAG: hypothetical protein A2798_02215 [Candidatus Levybacteria bacterium RIFCSPHIGHO2_01_FULL_37_17]OGH36693.1 MAG: hypothetical protein A2959_00205 [Candidatus Levybacteria bacterium RIFCSPLOWO2_01_FULL_38_23]
MALIKTSLICTVLNEEESVQELIDSIINQSVMPDEIIIVDGGSTDSTTEVIMAKIKNDSNLNLKLFIKKGNRSIGRNKAIEESSGDIILSTDAGCILEKNWVKNILEPFKNKKTDIVAGYYKGTGRNSFEKSLIPYVLVMKDRVVSNDFLPATRSVAFKKSVWRKVGGFDKNLSHNEDYAFANKIKRQGFKIYFQKSAVVNWIPPRSIFKAFKMFFSFAYGDIEAHLIRDKVIYIFLRYSFGIYLLILALIMKSIYLTSLVTVLGLSYVAWSIKKNYKYVKNYEGFLFLPLIQITSDIAVVSGSILALLNKVSIKKIMGKLIQNKGITVLVLIYAGIMVSMINWGIPNISHPFNYFMDEWHQAQSIRNLFTQGTINIEGSANGSIFHFFLSGLFLVPFYLLGIINPFAIESSVSNLELQGNLFVVLRLNTLLYGSMSIIIFYYICKKYFNLNPLISSMVFIFNPAWIMLSNYFKYDIALMFWTLLSFLIMLKYINNPTFISLLLAAIISSISLSVKLQPFFFPILLIIIFLKFTPDFKQKLKWIFISLFVYAIVFISLGIPDILLAKGDLSEYLSSVLIRTPEHNVSNIIINENIWQYLVTNIYPTLFGIVLFFVSALFIFIILMRIVVVSIMRKSKEQFFTKEELFLIIAFGLFTLSLIPLRLDATGNRALILLPFFAIFFALFWQIAFRLINKKIVLLLLVVFLLIQTIQTIVWIEQKILEDPRKLSSEWILNNVPKNSTIGVENIPIYQMLPDIVLREYYLKKQNLNFKTYYNYKVINKNENMYPKFVVLTNGSIVGKYFRKSEKTQIKKTLKKKGYREVAVFSPNFSNLKFFTSDIQYYQSAIIQVPINLAIYEKND